jgi:uncharacterized membrane protein
MRLPSAWRQPAAGRLPATALPAGAAALTGGGMAATITRGRHRQTRVPGGREVSWTWRALSTLAGMFVITWSFRLSGYLTYRAWLALPMVVLGLAGLLVTVAAWLPPAVLPPRRQQQLSLAALAATLAALALWSYFQVFTAPDYATDEIAFDQYAAQLALRGINPYLRSMAPAFPMFHVSPNGWTFQLNGQPVTALSYPALSFLVYLPLLAAGMTTQAAVWVNVAAWAAGAVILFAALPGRLAPLAAVVASVDIFISYAVGGVTDALFVPLLIGAAVGWDRFAARRGPAAWRGPVLLGLAMAVKQTPWLIAPFLVAGVVLESRHINGLRQGIRDGLRYAGIAAVAFGVPNLPYLLNAPGAWLRGILTPFLAHSVPAGQGLISLSLALPVGGGSLRAYNVTAILVLATCFGCFLASYRTLKPAAFLIPSLAMFFATRSFGSYLVMLIPAAVAGAVTIRTAPASACWRHWKWLALGGGAASAAAAAFALTSASPLTVSIKSVRTTGQLATIQQVTVAVSNRTGGSVQPAFTIANGANITAFWRRLAGPKILRPHQRATYTIVAPSYFAMPSIASGFQVLAFAGKPASVSRSSVYLANTWRLVLRPATIERPVAVGQQITVQAEIVDRLDRPVPAAGVPVYLGQVIYDQHGLQFSQAIVNQGLPGQTPVEALTNSAGVATFVIRSPVAGQDPVYFEANLVNSNSFYPYGYSPILAVRFRS